MKEFTIRKTMPADIRKIYSRVKDVFQPCAAPLYSEETTARQLENILLTGVLEKIRSQGLILTAEEDSDLVGLLAVRKDGHILLLHIDPDGSDKNTAEQLIKRAVEICRREKPTLKRLTVNSPPAVAAVYQRQGFVPSGSEQTTRRISFLPMVLTLSDS